MLAVMMASLSGCSLVGYRRVEKLADTGQETVTERTCKREWYPFSVTSHLWRTDAFVKDIDADSPGTRNLGRAVLTPGMIVFDAMVLPATMVTVFFPDCETKVHTQHIAGFPLVDRVSPTDVRQGDIVKLTGEGFSNKMVVRFDDFKAEIKDWSSTTATVVVPKSPLGQIDVAVRNSIGTSVPKTVTMLPSKPSMLEVSKLDFQTADKSRVLLGNKDGQVSFVLRNKTGAGDAFRITAAMSVSGETGVDVPSEIVIGDIKNGQNKRVTFPVRGTLGLGTGKAAIAIKFRDPAGFPPDPAIVSFSTRKLEVPDLAIAGVKVDDTFYPGRKDKLSVGNGNGIIEPGESAEVLTRLANRGTGETWATSIQVGSSAQGIDFLTKTAFFPGNIPPGGWYDLSFVVSVRKDYTDTRIPITLRISDDIPQFAKTVPLDLELGKAYSKTTIKDVAGHYKAPRRPHIPSFGDELLPPPRGASKDPDAVAVIIGARDYKNTDVPAVEYALNDAEVMKEYARATLGISADNIIYVANPSKADLERVFGTAGNPKGQLYNYIKPGKSDVFVYYSGHGAPDLDKNQAYLVPVDGDPNYVAMNGFKLQTLIDNLNAAPARKTTLVLDSCFAGGSEKGMLIAKASPLVLRVGNLRYGAVNFFASSSGSQISSWWPEKQHGLFTYHWLRALRGDADKDKTGKITARAVQNYLMENVPRMARRLHGREQTPEFVGDPDTVVARF
jgi:hypothetical protein